MEELTSIEGRLISQAVAGLREDFVEIKANIRTMSELLAGVATLQADQNSNRAAIDRAFTQIEKANGRIDDADKRLQKIEILVPGLVEARKWLIGIGITGLTMLMIAIASMVIRPQAFVPVMPLAPVAPAPTVVHPSLPPT